MIIHEHVNDDSSAIPWSFNQKFIIIQWRVNDSRMQIPSEVEDKPIVIY